MTNPAKWIVKFEYVPPGRAGSPSQVTREFYDLTGLGTDLTGVSDKSSQALKSLITASVYLETDYREYSSPAEITPPKKQELSGDYYIVWVGLDPETVAQWEIKTQVGDDTYDFQVLVQKKKEGEYKLLAITSDEENLTNTQKHLKNILTFILEEPTNTKYVRFFRLQLTK